MSRKALPPIAFKNSIATLLLRTIFVIYFSITIIVTIAQITIEYHDTKNQVVDELKSLQKTTESGLANSLWELNMKQLSLLLDGIMGNKIVIGVLIHDDEGRAFEVGKTISSSPRPDEQTRIGRRFSKSSPHNSNIFWYEFPLIYKGKTVGNATFYSSSTVIIQKVKLGVILIIISAIIKTLALWIIFLLVIKKILGKPLLKFTEKISEIRLDELSTTNIQIFHNKTNELYFLQQTFNELVSNLAKSHSELDEINRTLEKKVEQRTNELMASKNAAEDANRAKSLFLANMSHEVRTPLNAILGFTEIMKSRIEDPQLSSYLDSIHSSGKSLLSLINDILDISKVEAGRLELEYTAVSPEELFNEMQTIFERKITDKKLKLLIDIPPGLPKALLLDETRLRQILINLIGNAVKFTETGYIRLSINCSYPGDNSRSTLDLIFSVEDTGKGIHQDHLESIFEAFTQSKGQKISQFGGTGLGLTITKRLIEMMAGRIEVMSEVNKGSAFKVILKDVEITSMEAAESGRRKKNRLGCIPLQINPV